MNLLPTHQRMGCGLRSSDDELELYTVCMVGLTFAFLPTTLGLIVLHLSNSLYSWPKENSPCSKLPSWVGLSIMFFETLISLSSVLQIAFGKSPVGRIPFKNKNLRIESGKEIDLIWYFQCTTSGSLFGSSLQRRKDGKGTRGVFSSWLVSSTM